MKNFMIAQRDSNRSGLIASTLAVVAFSFASPAQARDNASLSISINVPGAVYPSYAYPVYTQPPVYVPPRAVYVQPAPVYYQPAPVYYSSAPVYYEYAHGRKYGHYKKHKKHDRDDDDRYGRHDDYQRSYYAPVYYQR